MLQNEYIHCLYSCARRGGGNSPLTSHWESQVDKEHISLGCSEDRNISQLLKVVKSTWEGFIWQWLCDSSRDSDGYRISCSPSAVPPILSFINLFWNCGKPKIISSPTKVSRESEPKFPSQISQIQIFHSGTICVYLEFLSVWLRTLNWEDVLKSVSYIVSNCKCQSPKWSPHCLTKLSLASNVLIYN